MLHNNNTSITYYLSARKKKKRSNTRTSPYFDLHKTLRQTIVIPERWSEE
ncbi:unnamed protein product [Nezara viridula]|uniref:Uncharacterized protein n=1 Tax=Nezara viridula TaxID=85310 RepID=A0A9P0HDJ3_NEZVI|nr:unnamed protein product [Nezara viridula]